MEEEYKMKLQILRYFSSVFVEESDASEKDKLFLINKIRESEKDEILDFLFTGTFNEQVIVESEKLFDMENFIESLISEASINISTDFDFGKAKGYGKKAKDFGTKAAKDIKGKVQPYSGMAKKAGVAAAAVAVAAAIITASSLAYKKYFSKASRACKGKSGEEKNKCMKMQRGNALKAQMATLKSGISKCSQSKNPTKCRQKVIKRMDEIKYKLAKLNLQQ